jgi:curved DNA-binding protein
VVVQLDLDRSNFGGGFGFDAPDLDTNAQVTIPFDVAVIGGKQNIIFK